MWFYIVLVSAAITLLVFALNQISYRFFGAAIRQQRERWDLNICCGKTDGGGINVDIVPHADLPNLILVDSIYDLPFTTDQFEHTLCSHTLEHVEDPAAFFAELQRVSQNVTLVVPPIWDIAAALNIVEHRWLFLTWRKQHHSLPPRLALPFAQAWHEKWGQKIRA